MKKIALGFILLGLIGCATQQRQGYYYISVDAINDPTKLEKKKYILLPGNKDIAQDNLQFKEYAEYVNRALQQKGFIEVKERQDAELVVFALYGISDPKTYTNNYSYPVLGATGGGYSSFNSNTYSGGLSATTQGSVYTYPQLGVVGQAAGTLYRDFYTRYLLLDAIDAAEVNQSQKYISAWRTEAASTGASGDLRIVFPALIAGMKDYIATNPKQQVHIELPLDDPKILEIRNGTSDGKRP